MTKRVASWRIFTGSASWKPSPATTWKRRDFFEKLLRSFRDGRYEKELEGVGSIRITSTPRRRDR